MVSRAETLKIPPGKSRFVRTGGSPEGAESSAMLEPRFVSGGCRGPSSEYLVSLGSPLPPETGSQIISGV